MYMFNVYVVIDIMGFGILGYVQNLVKQQRNEVLFVIYNFLVLVKMVVVSKVCGNMFGFMYGICLEILGGFLICLLCE